MLRLLLALLFLISVPQVCRATHSCPTELYGEELAVLYVGAGHARLLQSDFLAALDDFEMATFVLEFSKTHLPGLSSLIYFGEAIAYDNIDEPELSQMALGSLNQLVVAAENDASNHGSFSDGDSNSLALLRHIASLAKSSSVRAALQSFVTKMETEPFK